MRNGFTSLIAQLDFCRSQAETIEGWKREHDLAMACRLTEDVIEIALAALRNLRRHNQGWADLVERQEEAFSWDTARRFADAYRKWQDLAEDLVRSIDACKDHGFSVEGENKLREAQRGVSLMPLEIDRVRESIESLERGNGVPFAQAMDELRSHLQ